MTPFSGFQERDFGTVVRGTHWRHRRALGGELSLHLRKVYGDRYQTWGLPGANILHVARRVAYRFPPDATQAALFVSAAPDALRWGALIPSAGKHWRRFIFRLESDAAALPLLLHLLFAHELTFTDLSDDTGGILGGCWRYEQGELTWREACSLPRSALPADILYRLSALPSAAPCSLALFTQVSPETALAWGADAAQHLTPQLVALVPLYELCINPLP